MMVKVYSNSRINWKEFHELIISYLENKDPRAERLLYEHFDNIITGLISKRYKYIQKFGIETCEELKNDVIYKIFSGLLPKLNLRGFENNSYHIYRYIEKGISFILTTCVQPYRTKHKRHNATQLNEYYTTQGFEDSIEDQIDSKDYMYSVYELAMYYTKEELGVKYNTFLNYIIDNRMYDVLLNTELFNRAFDLSAHISFKIRQSYKNNVERVLLEIRREEEMAKTKVIKESDIEVMREKQLKEVHTRVISSERFSPDIDGEVAMELQREIFKGWVPKAWKLGKIIARAKVHFIKQRPEFVKWLKKYLRMSESQGMAIKKVGSWDEELIKRLIDRGYTSTHVIKLQPLKDKYLITEFLKKKEHAVDKEGTMVETKKMTAKEVQAAVKIIKQVPEEEKSENEMFFAVVKKLDTFLEKNTDLFTKDIINVKKKKIQWDYFTPEEMSMIMNLKDRLQWFEESYSEKLAILSKEED